LRTPWVVTASNGGAGDPIRGIPAGTGVVLSINVSP
jgi:hypothetical protein